jgi:glycosyltransferase involved in cell wall biosynthesis
VNGVGEAVGFPGMTDGHSKLGAGSFRVLAWSAGFEPGFRGGGPIRSVAAMVDTISDTTDLLLITGDRDLGESDPYPGLSGRWIARGRSRVFYLNTHRLGQWLKVWNALRLPRFELMYVNSLWEPRFTILPILAVRLGVIPVRRILIAPRGELSPGALSLKGTKKRLFLRLWRPFLNGKGVLWHATSELEASDIKAVFAKAQIVINPNQVTLPRDPLPVTENGSARARMVFIGRIAAKKNLDLVVAALGMVFEKVDFDIYGPLEDERYWTKCRALMSRCPPNIQVSYRGDLASSAVRRTFADYDAFVFPTRGENFGHVIAESLSASCPVICSANTPWTPVLLSGGGAVVTDLTAHGLSKEITRFAGMAPRERFRAKQAAGAAYRSWSEGYHVTNILELVRRIGSSAG